MTTAVAFLWFERTGKSWDNSPAPARRACPKWQTFSPKWWSVLEGVIPWLQTSSRYCRCHPDRARSGGEPAWA